MDRANDDVHGRALRDVRGARACNTSGSATPAALRWVAHSVPFGAGSFDLEQRSGLRPPVQDALGFRIRPGPLAARPSLPPAPAGPYAMMKRVRPGPVGTGRRSSRGRAS
jgi:hypothetical protein